PTDVSRAIHAQNLILPTGTAKMGETEYSIRINSSPELSAEFNDLPIKVVHGATVYVKDVAHVRDGYAPQTSMVHEGGNKGALLSILKSSSASTLEVVGRVRAALPRIMATVSSDLKLKLLFDQSVFVRAAIRGLVHEAVIASALTGLMLLLFLG